MGRSNLFLNRIRLTELASLSPIDVHAHMQQTRPEFTRMLLHLPLDTYPNFAVDTAARLSSFMLLPRDTVRPFLLEYQDRILYGTDFSFLPGESGAATAVRWRNRYLAEWRYLATDDPFVYQGIYARGLALPRSILRKIYHDNALRWIPDWSKRNGK